MKYYEVLFNAKDKRTCGNHRAKVEYCGTEKYCIKFYYFDALICQVFLMEKKFYLSDGGWNTISTHKAMANYYRFFKSKKFRLAGLHLSGFYGIARNFINW